MGAIATVTTPHHHDCGYAIFPDIMPNAQCPMPNNRTAVCCNGGYAIALQEWERRKQLDAIDKALQEIENALIEVMPQKNNKA